MKKLKALRCKTLVFLTHHMGLPALKLFRKPKVFPWTKDELLKMDNGTVGRELIEFINNKNLELLTYYARHDMKHIVLGFDTTEEGELCLQSFMLGNGRISFPVLATVLFGLFTAPGHWKKMLSSFRTGRRCISIHQWDWFSLVPLQIKKVQNLIFNNQFS